MKRLMAMGIVMLSAAVAVQAAPTVYAEITFPTSTTWKLWLTETTNWDGNPADMTPGGLGIAGFCFGLPGATSGLKATPAYVNLETTDDPPVTVGSVGFSVGPSIANTDVKGNIQAFAGQDITVPQGVCYGFGVTAGSYTVPDANMYQTTGPYSWAAPGAPGSANPGVLVFSGKRNAGQAVSIDYSQSQVNVFTGIQTLTNGVVDAAILVPEPCALLLLTMGGLAAWRRRRR